MAGGGTIECEPDVNRAPFLLVFGFYLSWMMGIAITSRQRVSNIAEANKEINHYVAHYGGGRNYGSILTFLTLFSTIFSGYTVLGIPQEANDLGYFATRWMFIILPAILCLVTFTPRMRRLAAARNYCSLGDLITDRYNCKMLTMICAFFWMGLMTVTIISQIFQVFLLIPVIGGLDSQGQPMLHPKTTIICIGAVIAFCEMMGGFDSVAISDAAQSAVMLMALIMVPVATHMTYGGAGGTTMSNCQNSEVISCSAGTNNSFGIEATCMPGCAGGKSKFTNGCLEDLPLGGPLTTHPAVTFASYYHNTSISPPVPYVSKLPNDGFLFDAVEYGNFQWLHYAMFAIMILFGFCGNVPNSMRVFNAKSDDAIKRGATMLIMSCYIATLPSILIGIQINANLRSVYQKPPNSVGASAYGILMTDFLRRGGFYAFLSVIGSCSAVAAAMSTIDSNLIAIGNVLTNDILNNIIVPAFPKLSSPFALSVINKCLTISVMAIVVGTVTNHCAFNAEVDCPLVKGRSITKVSSKLQNWGQSMSGMSAFPIAYALYGKNSSPLPAIIAIISMAAAFISTWMYIDNIFYWGTDIAYSRDGPEIFGSSPIKTFYFNTARTPNFVLPIGFIFAYILSRIIPDRIKFFKYDKALFRNFNSDGSEGNLTKEKILVHMENTQEPLKTKIGVGALIVAVLIMIGVLPMKGVSHNGCTVLSWGKNKASGSWGIDGCTEPKYLGGMPEFATIVIIGCCISNVFLLVAISRWVPQLNQRESNPLQGIFSTKAKIQPTQEMNEKEKEINEPLEKEPLPGTVTTLA